MTQLMAVQGHRGSPDPTSSIGENTLDAFRRALRLGADGVELDVRMTADGIMAVHHGPAVDGLGPIHELTANQLPDHVPRLEAALEACVGMTVNIEIKNLPTEPSFDAEEHLAMLVADLVVSVGRQSGVVVSSFWPATLEAVHVAAPEIPTGLLLASWFDPSMSVGVAMTHGCTAIHPHHTLVSRPLIEEAHAAGLSVAAWTVNERPQVETLMALDLDTVITDDVAMARATVGRR